MMTDDSTGTMSVAEALAKAREYDKKHADIPSVSRTLADEVERLQARVAQLEPFEPLKDTARPSRLRLSEAQRIANYNSHKPRFSDSSLYDEVCTACGAKDYAIGKDELSARYCTGVTQCPTCSAGRGGQLRRISVGSVENDLRLCSDYFHTVFPPTCTRESWCKRFPGHPGLCSSA